MCNNQLSVLSFICREVLLLFGYSIHIHIKLHIYIFYKRFESPIHTDVKQ